MPSATSIEDWTAYLQVIDETARASTSTAIPPASPSQPSGSVPPPFQRSSEPSSSSATITPRWPYAPQDLSTVYRDIGVNAWKLSIPSEIMRVDIVIRSKDSAWLTNTSIIRQGSNFIRDKCLIVPGMRPSGLSVIDLTALDFAESTLEVLIGILSTCEDSGYIRKTRPELSLGIYRGAVIFGMKGVARAAKGVARAAKRCFEIEMQQMSNTADTSAVRAMLFKMLKSTYFDPGHSAFAFEEMARYDARECQIRGISEETVQRHRGNGYGRLVLAYMRGERDAKFMGMWP